MLAMVCRVLSCCTTMICCARLVFFGFFGFGVGLFLEGCLGDGVLLGVAGGWLYG